MPSFPNRAGNFIFNILQRVGGALFTIHYSLFTIYEPLHYSPALEVGNPIPHSRFPDSLNREQQVLVGAWGVGMKWDDSIRYHRQVFGSTHRPGVSIVVPCFNEVGAIADTVRRMRSVMAQGGAFEIVVVDDGSDDGSLEVARSLRTDHGPGVVAVVRHEANLGYGAAVKTGIRTASSALLAIIDADGTYPVEEMPTLVAEMQAADMVVGVRRTSAPDESVSRRAAKAALRRYASWLAGTRIPDVNSGMRVFRRDVVDSCMGLLPDGFSLTTTLTVAAIRGGYRVRYVPIQYNRRIGRSKIRRLPIAVGMMRVGLVIGVVYGPLSRRAPR